MKWIATMILMMMAGTACADGARLTVPANAKWKEECSSCHVAYPPQLLDRQGWGKLMSRLDRHFGVDASLEPAERKEILSFLRRHAGSGTRHASRTQRISDTAWFIHEHREVSSRLWNTPMVRSRSNCTACHVRAESGDWSERGIRMPGGRFEDDDD